MIVYICGGYFEDFVICEISLVRLERPAPTSFFLSEKFGGFRKNN